MATQTKWRSSKGYEKAYGLPRHIAEVMYQDADYDHNEMLKLISRYRRGQYVPKTRAQLQANPSIPAQLRRLPSGEIQLKIPLSAKNVKAQVQAIRKALGRRVKSAVIVGGKIARKVSRPARRRKR